MMKKAILILLVILLTIPSSAFALSAELVPDSLRVETDDMVQVEVDFRENGIGAIYAAFTYDPQLLEYIEGEGSAAANGQGSIVLYASSSSANRLQTVLKFRAKAMGTAQVSVEVKEALSFDEQPLNKPTASVEISTVRPADAYVIVEAGGARKDALCKPPYLPQGYSETIIDIAGKEVSAATDGTDVYVYLTEPDSESGGYYLRENGEYLPAVCIAAEKLLLPLPQELPAGFSPASLTVNGSTYEGCSDGTQALVYALSEEGTPAFYLYDSTDNTLQRYHTDVLTVTEYVDLPADPDYTRLAVLGIIFLLLLLGILIAVIVKRSH